VIDVTW